LGAILFEALDEVINNLFVVSLKQPVTIDKVELLKDSDVDLNATVVSSVSNL